MHKANVLLIEDSVPDTMLLKLALDSAGLSYNLTSLRDGEKAIEYLREHGADAEPKPPDLILLDLNVPKVGGLEILEEIRGANRFLKIPVVVLSSSRSPRAESAVLSMHGTRFEIKPAHLDGFLELGQTIRTFLEEALRDGFGDSARTLGA